MKEFYLVITEDREIIYRGRSTYCGVTTLSGSIGFEADHEPFTALLLPHSEIRFSRSDSGDDSLKIEDGIVTFKDNRCTVAVSISS